MCTGRLPTGAQPFCPLLVLVPVASEYVPRPTSRPALCPPRRGRGSGGRLLQSPAIHRLGGDLAVVRTAVVGPDTKTNTNVDRQNIGCATARGGRGGSRCAIRTDRRTDLPRERRPRTGPPPARPGGAGRRPDQRVRRRHLAGRPSRDGAAH